MRFAVQDTFDGRIIAKLEGALAVVAAEAGAVVGAAVGGELLDRVHLLAAGGALLRRACGRRIGRREEGKGERRRRWG